MIDKLEIDALMESTAVVVREYVAQTESNLMTLMADLEKRLLQDIRQRIDSLVAASTNGNGHHKDFDPELFRSLIDREVSTAIADVTKERQSDTAVLLQRIDELERQLKSIPAGPVGKPGEPGKDVDPTFVQFLVDAAVTKSIAALPPPPAGRDGRDASVETITQLVKAEVAAIPKPKDGRDGVDGQSIKGQDGKDGQSIKGDKGEPGESVDHAVVVAEVLSKIPTPRDGRDGENGKDAEPLDRAAIVAEILTQIPIPKDGRDGENGRDGKDAPELDPALVADLVLLRMPIPKNGRDGVDGRDGKDADVEAARNFILDEVARVVAELPRPVDGKDGKDVSLEYVRDVIAGEVLKATAHITSGRDGRDGKDAEPIHPDTLRVLVGEEVTRQIALMPKPKDGEPGRDALQVDTLHEIDETKSYSRGTYAWHRNGLWLARRKTLPVTESMEKAGWDICMEGQRLKVSQDTDPRVLIISHEFPGRSEIEKLHIPAQMFKGVWREVNDYVRGDGVQHSGSQWHCNVDGTKERPGTGNDWTLTAKRGADGKDLRPPEPPPPQGPVRLK